MKAISKRQHGSQMMLFDEKRTALNWQDLAGPTKNEVVMTLSKLLASVWRVRLSHGKVGEEGGGDE